jgi:hypothetical protein
MLVSYNWLNEYVDLNGISPDELAEKNYKERYRSRRCRDSR